MDQDHTEKIEDGLKIVSGDVVRSCPKCGLSVPADVDFCPADGSVIDLTLVKGAIIAGKYELVELLGSGGMGSVYKARQIVMDKMFALKFLNSRNYSGKAANRFVREAKAVGRLDHVNIVKVYDVGQTDNDQLYMLMDLVAGQTLAEKLNQCVQLPVDDALKIFLQIAGAMEHAHANGILHRDLKPSNVMLVPDLYGADNVKVLDFGIAKVMQEPGQANPTLTSTGEVIGSPLYMSPEQGAGGLVDARSDVYSLGCLMFETLTGAAPFHGSTVVATMMLHQTAAPPTLREAAMGRSYPPGLEDLIQRCLAKSPADRVQSMGEVQNRLRGIAAGEPVPIATDEKRTVTWPFIAAISTAVALILVAIFALTIKPPAPSTAIKAQTVASTNPAPQPMVADLTTDEFNDNEVKLDLKKHHDGADLDLSQAKCSPATWALLGERKQIPELRLDYSNVTDADLAYLSHTTIDTLQLKNTDITDKGLRSIAKIKGLRVLDITRTKVTDSGLQYLASVPTLSSINVCDCDRVRCANLKPLAQMPSLWEFLADNIRTSPENFVNLKYLLTVRRLRLGNTSFNDDSARCLPALKNLGYLKFENCKITDSALLHIGKLSNLRDLILSGTDVSEPGLRQLKQCKYLRTLDLTNCHKISRADVVKFNAYLPDCVVKLSQDQDRTDDFTR